MSETPKELTSSLNTLSFQNVVSYSGCLIIYLHHVHQVSTKQTMPLSPLSIASCQYPHFLHRCPASRCLWTSTIGDGLSLKNRLLSAHVNTTPRSSLISQFPIHPYTGYRWVEEETTHSCPGMSLRYFQHQEAPTDSAAYIKKSEMSQFASWPPSDTQEPLLNALVSEKFFVFTASHLSTK